MDFKNIEYLSEGNFIQRKSYKILKKIEIFTILKEFNPILVGTIPLGINVENSDLDIVCELRNRLKKIIIENFSKYSKFQVRERKDSFICNFFVENIEIEIYASKIKSEETNGYKHMVIENKILKITNSRFKKAVIELKKEKIKTEPAFAKILKIEGDSYEKLLELEKYSEKELELLIDKIYLKKYHNMIIK